MHKTMDRLRGKAALLSLSALTALSVGAGAMSFAAFTGDADVTTNGFTTGTVDISTTPASSLFNVSGILPGYSETQALDVTNSGTSDVDYTMSTSATNSDSKNLRSQMTLLVTEEDVDGGCDDLDGTQLYSGALASGALSSRFLAALDAETLCFQVVLPSSTGNAFQNAATTVTFTFNATPA